MNGLIYFEKYVGIKFENFIDIWFVFMIDNLKIGRL